LLQAGRRFGLPAIVITAEALLRVIRAGRLGPSAPAIAPRGTGQRFASKTGCIAPQHRDI
jgi:hypothetical protein